MHGVGDLCHHPLKLLLVDFAVSEGNGERMSLHVWRQLVDLRRDHRGVLSTAEIEPDGNISLKTISNCVCDVVSQAINVAGLGLFVINLADSRIIEVPVFVDVRMRVREDVTTALETIDVLEHRSRADNAGKRKDLVQSRQVNLA